MSSFAATRDARPTRIDTFAHDSNTFRKDTTHMFQADLRLAEIREQHDLHRLVRHGERHDSGRGRSIRRRFGESLMRLGRRIGGDALNDARDVMTTPAWQG
jgi:hypothetical protein